MKADRKEGRQAKEERKERSKPDEIVRPAPT